ncbi:MAG: hypothetical protein HYV63_29455 [Candidatus Schekmanbacteria bacterium]|nr:hypothetical protein [Candidatus Schekmanbacteria bacterium]
MHHGRVLYWRCGGAIHRKIEGECGEPVGVAIYAGYDTISSSSMRDETSGVVRIGGIAAFVVAWARGRGARLILEELLCAQGRLDTDRRFKGRRAWSGSGVDKDVSSLRQPVRNPALQGGIAAEPRPEGRGFSGG